MSLRVVQGYGGSGAQDAPSGCGPRTGLHLVPLPDPSPADRRGAGRHRSTTFAVTVDDLIERECAAPDGRASAWILALAARRGLLPAWT